MILGFSASPTASPSSSGVLAPFGGVRSKRTDVVAAWTGTGQSDAKPDGRNGQKFKFRIPKSDARNGRASPIGVAGVLHANPAPRFDDRLDIVYLGSRFQIYHPQNLLLYFERL